MRVSFDTNIALYALADVSDPAKTGVARKLLEDLRINGEGVISTQVLKEFANVCTKKLRPHVSQASLFIYLEVLNGFDLIAVDAELSSKLSFDITEAKSASTTLSMWSLQLWAEQRYCIQKTCSMECNSGISAWSTPSSKSSRFCGRADIQPQSIAIRQQVFRSEPLLLSAKSGLCE